MSKNKSVHESRKSKLERLILAYSPKFQGMLRAAEQQIKEGKGITHDDLWKSVEEVNSPPSKD